MLRRLTALFLLLPLLLSGAPAFAASGNTLFVFTAAHAEPPAANFATFDVRNATLVLEFDQSTDESTVFRGVMPQHYAGGGVTCKIKWYGDTGLTTGDVVWDLSWERGTTDIDADDFAAVQSVTSTTNGTSGILTESSIAFTNGAQMDSVVAGDAFRLKLNRDANNGSDTMAGDAQVVSVECRES
jgi:hypothetical protein